MVSGILTSSILIIQDIGWYDPLQKRTHQLSIILFVLWLFKHVQTCSNTSYIRAATWQGLDAHMSVDDVINIVDMFEDNNK